MKKTVYYALPLTLAALALSGCMTTGDASMDAEEAGITKPLTSTPGDAVKGRKLALTRSKGNCVACHVLPGDDVTFPGNAGPDMVEAMQNMERSVGWIRQKIVDPKVDNPDTVMFTFYSNAGKKRVRKDWVGKTVLSAQEVEDVIAYLLTLR